MIDSGASANFISFDLFRDLGIKYSTEKSQQVRLANGGMLQTNGECVLNINFGAVKYSGSFHVLAGRVPLILGMTFLKDLCPKIDFCAKQVMIGNKKLHVVNLARAHFA